MIETRITNTPHWLYSLPPSMMEPVLAEMRSMRERSDRYREESRKLQPRFGEVGGGAHIDPFAKGEVIATFLSSLSKGKGILESVDEARQMGRDIFTKWNSQNKDIHVHRWVESCDTFADSLGVAMTAIFTRAERSGICESCGG